MHRADPAYCELADCSKPIDICIWRPETGEIDKVGVSTAWNYQQGSRLQWLPGKTDSIAYNVIVNGKPFSIILDLENRERRELPAPIYTFSPDGQISISPNFTTLAHCWRAYGYTPLAANPTIRDQNADGLWQLDVTTGKESLFISTSRVANFRAIPESKHRGTSSVM